MSLDLSHLAEPDLRAIVNAGPGQVPAHYREAAREALAGGRGDPAGIGRRRPGRWPRRIRTSRCGS